MRHPPEFSMFMTTRGLHVMPMNHAAIFILSLFDAEGNGIMDDIFNEEFKHVEVDRLTMVKLAGMVGITADGREN